MDVTFFEQQPYYPRSNIQGENYTQEHQLWDIEANIPNLSHSPSNSYTYPNSQIPQRKSPKSFVPTPSPQLEIP